MKKRLISLTLCFVMLTTIIPLTASAQTAQSIEIADFGTKTYGDGAFKVNVIADAASMLTNFTYESSNPDVAEIGTDGTVTITGAGETVITVKQAGNASFAPAEVSKTLTVNKKDIMLSSIDVESRNAEFIGILDEDADKVSLDFDKLDIELTDEMTPEEVEDVMVQQGCVKIRGVVTENMYTEIWGEKDIDTLEEEYVGIDVVDAFGSTNKAFPTNSYGELVDAPYEYLVDNTNAADLIGMSVIAYVREVNYNWEIVSIEADAARNSILEIGLDQFNQINSNGKFEYYESETSKTATAVNIDDDVAVVYNNVGGFWIDDIFGVIVEEDGATLDGGKITLIDNNDTKGYDVIFVEVVETAVVDEAEEGYVTFKEATGTNGITELEVDEDDTDRVVVVTKDGEAIELADLAEWDVLSVYAAWDDASYIVAEVIDNPVIGIITSQSKSTTSDGGYAYKIGDAKYDVAVGAYGVSGIAVGDGGTFYIDKYGKIAAFKEDYELAAGIEVNYAYVTAVAEDEDILTGKKTAIFQLVTADGVVALNLKASGAKLNGSTVTADDDIYELEALAETMIKYSTNSSDEIISITEFECDDTITGGMYGASVDYEYDLDYGRFIGSGIYIDSDSYIFFIDPYDAEDSYLGTVADLTDGECYEIMGKYADKYAEDYNIVLISMDVERPEAPEVETDKGYGYVTAVAFDENILTGRNTALVQLVTENGVEVFSLKKRTNLNGVTVNADDNEEEIENLCETLIRYSVNESGDISSIVTADSSDSLTGGVFEANYTYNGEDLRFGDDTGFDLTANAQIVFVDPDNIEDSFIGTASNLTDGESYDIMARYADANADSYSIIVILADVERPEAPEVETDMGYAYVTAVAFDEDILTGKKTALVQLVTEDGLVVRSLKAQTKLDGVTVRADDNEAEIMVLEGRVIKYSVIESGEISSIETADNDEALAGGMYANAVSAEFDLENSAFVGIFTVDANAKIFFIDENDAENSYIGTIADLIDGVDYEVLGQYAEGESSSIVVIKSVSGVVSKKAGLAVITAVGPATNKNEEEIFSLVVLSDGEEIIADTTSNVFYDVEDGLTVGDIVKLNINKDGVIDGLAIVYDFADGVRAKYDVWYDLSDYAVWYTQDYMGKGYEEIAGGVVDNYRKSSTLATIDAQEFKLSQADNIYVIDANGRRISITNGSTSYFKYYEALYTAATVDVTIGDAEYEAVDVEDARRAADYVFVRAYDGRVTDVVIVKGVEDMKVRGCSYYSLNTMSVDENESVELMALPQSAVAAVSNFVLTGEKADDYNLITEYAYTVVDSSNLASLTVVEENTKVTGAESGTYTKGAAISLTAVAEPGYVFKGWYVDGICVSTDKTYEFALESDVEVTAKAEIKTGVSSCGTDINGNTWCLYERGVLEIEGNGAMPDYSGTAMIPWYAYRGMITEVSIGDGITHIGDRSFYNCISVKKASIPESVASIGANAFYNCDEMTIYGVSGGYAEIYATENNIPFAEYVKTEKLSEIAVEMTENEKKWYFDVSLAEISKTVNVHIAIYDESGRMLAIVSDVLATDDVTTLSMTKNATASYAKVHIVDENAIFAAISKRIDF